MSDWTEDFHGLLLAISGAMNDPNVDTAFVRQSGAPLEPILFPLLSRIGAFGPIGTVRLAELVGRDHTTVSRQVGRLVAAELVEHVPTDDKRFRLLRPTKAGEDVLARLAAARRATMERHFEKWDRTDLDRFIDLLGRAIEDIHSLFPNGSRP